MRRRLCALLLLLTLLSGCGGEAAPRSSEAPAPAAPAAAEIAAPSPAPETPPPPPAETPSQEPDDTALVKVTDEIPTILVELKYATEDNFTGSVIYDFTDAYLRYGTVKKLAAVQAGLMERGYGLKIWDAYRPAGAQLRLWEICPDPRYVADPNIGFSGHSRGNTVDVTLVGADGTELEMPTGFDDFSPLADRDYSDVGEPARSNALLLERAMTAGGFIGYSGEWWHFSDSVSYPPVEDEEAA